MADRDFNIEIVGAPSPDEIKGPVGAPIDPTIKKPNTSWWYNNVGVAITYNLHLHLTRNINFLPVDSLVVF